MYRIRVLMLVGLFSILLAACSNHTIPTIHERLEEAVKLEKVFEEKQEPLLVAEKKEHELYQELILLNAEEFEDIQSLSSQAISVVNEREEMIAEEKESIEAGYEAFSQAIPEFEKLPTTELQEMAYELQDLMDQRYEAYQDFYQEYIQALEVSEQLYVLFQDEALEMEALQKQIKKVNNSYQSIFEKEALFNKYTDAYNHKKITFFEAADAEMNDES